MEQIEFLQSLDYDTKWGLSSTIYEYSRNRTNIFPFLLKANIMDDVKITSIILSYRNTMLNLAKEKINMHTMIFLVSCMDKSDILILLRYMCFEAQYENVKFLIETLKSLIYPECVSVDEETFCLASFGGNMNITKELMETDPINIQNYMDKALVYASKKDHLDIAKLLIKNKADVNFGKDTSNVSALNNACLRGHKNMVKLLLDNKASVDEASCRFAKARNHETILLMLMGLFTYVDS
jgi:hypothetical protein